MLNEIYLQMVRTSEQYQEILKMMKTEKGIREIFFDKEDRLFCNEVCLLIKKERETIGFLYLTVESIPGILFLDMGIKEKYRGLGIAKLMCQELINRITTEKFIIAETTKGNAKANASALYNGILVYDTDNLNYYLIDKTREQEFKNSNLYNNFISYCNSEKPKQYQFIRQLRDET